MQTVRQLETNGCEEKSKTIAANLYPTGLKILLTTVSSSNLLRIAKTYVGGPPLDLP
jgi:hypothetical protein